MPGTKDCLSVLGSVGKRVLIQKRLVLCNLKEAYSEFKTQHPDTKIGFTKFSNLRPKECVLLELVAHILYAFAHSTKMSN